MTHTAWTPPQPELSRSVRKELNAIADIAHARALRNALESLVGDFEEWKAGRIDSFELADKIHEFHDGPNREFYVRFSDRRALRLPDAAAYAIANGLVDESTISAETKAFLESLIRFYRKELESAASDE